MSIGAEQLPQNEDVALVHSLSPSRPIDPIAETELVAAGDKAEADVLDVQRSGIYVIKRRGIPKTIPRPTADPSH